MGERLNISQTGEKIPHRPVLFDEVMELFAPLGEEGGGKGKVFIDCTLGFGGHTAGILEKYPGVQVVGIDRDREALEFSRKRLAKWGERVEFYHGRASELLPEIAENLRKRGLKIGGVLADIGVSSYQLDQEKRGFNFESPQLDMRMDQTQPLSAREVVNHYPRQKLEEIFRNYGEIRNPRRIVEAIVKARPIVSNRELAQVLGKVGIKNKKGLAPIFQAIRIEVNDELGELEQLLDKIGEIGEPGMVAGIITFHSLEDRAVKRRFKEWAKRCICPPDAPRCSCGGDNQLGIVLTKKPIVAGEREIRENPRARSAKLRGFLFTRPVEGGAV
ncbi:MAG: 16S rRNA (cytosine(1402)-N(4))-methyltransferase [Epsilonproteobacteria bacterium]|nr:16S rRNA (cytosine(1402)-N(4))-methyltransferase [Campylobacterota bacterium]NPA89108.1 16S rRNA (cytosine(1402)-N(4))-methyltransferase RsmH [Campylobacterota bacterium]